ncbi:YhgE/Pip domain-containing protein [Anaeromicropila herbilytica]|uniref:ABC-2 type transporter transmembrane domain-containing protein n=1 Tax=Anaeromicropila herbilytica TaxID=2785025 RepID=A0A7R7ICW2_9FIRM|nr:YhgE/Pip domain-containing protein [Anaeromicropila herbilytica]BCN31173.1 hypothetical protein bsdtb5_24680 [Anaeromicropila herbilytica]
MKEKMSSKKIASIIVIIGVIIVPLLYSFFYLDAFWDPYSSLETLPVAIVNEDKGAVINDEQRNVGQELCDKLKDEGTLKFIFTDADTAKKGVEGKKYYSSITIPNDFSESIKSASTTDKKTAELIYVTNEKRNYLASQILKSAVLKIEMSVRSSVDKEIVSNLADKLKSTPDKLTTLSDGLQKLYDGSSDLQSGTSKLNDGAKDLKNGATKLANGSSKLISGTSDLKNGISTLTNGTDKLAAGSKSLKTGTSTFNSKLKEYQSGVNTATTGSKSLSDNMAKLDTGINKLLAGATQLETATKNINDLKTGSSSLAAGAEQLNTGITTYTTGVDSLVANVTKTTQVLAAYAQKTGDKTIGALVAQLTSKENLASIQALSQASTTLKTASGQISAGASKLSAGTANVNELQSGISQLKAGLQNAKDGSGKLTTGSKTLNQGMTKLNTATTQLVTASAKISTGASTLNNGLAQLKAGASKLYTGAGSLFNGASTLNNGVLTLKDGTVTLATGTYDLNDGATKINDGIQTAKDKVDDSITDANEQIKALDGLDEYAKEPVNVDTSKYAPVPNYGTAFAPYFMSLSLWVGGLMIFFGIYLDADEKYKLLARNSTNKVLRTFAYLLIGVVQAVFLAIILLVCLGLKVKSIPLFVASCILVSLVFIAIIQFFLIFFKDVGKFLALLMLILQLTSCGGTFPMETVPKVFNVLYPFMPMTYSVGLFKEAISGVGHTSLAWHNGIVLLAIFFIITALTLLLTAGKKIQDNKLAEV